MALIEGKSDTSHSLVVLTAGFPAKVGHNVKNKQTYEKKREKKALTESGGRVATWSMRNQASWRDETNTQLHDSDAMPRTEETHSLSLYFDGAVEPSVGVSRMYMGLHGRWQRCCCRATAEAAPWYAVRKLHYAAMRCTGPCTNIN